MINKIANVCKTSALHLRNIMKIGKYLLAIALKCIRYLNSPFVYDR